MNRALYADKKWIVDILVNSFADNKSVNYIIKQDGRKLKRIEALMSYSFDLCFRYGEIFVTKDKQGCVLILIPEKKPVTLQTILLDIKLVFSAIGWTNIRKAAVRESQIKGYHPKIPMFYLWFIGVNTDAQNKGIGSALLMSVINEAMLQKRVICLETSTEKNVPWYRKHGFDIYKELDFGYKLYCMKREN